MTDAGLITPIFYLSHFSELKRYSPVALWATLLAGDEVMSDEMERGQIEMVNQASDRIRNPATGRYNVPVVSSRYLIVGRRGQTGPKPVSITQQPARPWDFLKRLSRSDHSGWLITTLVFILVVTMSLSFGFVKGWVDAQITLSASVIFFVVLLGAMIIAHWPTRIR